MDARPTYQRFVALGDSQTEGLWDGDDRTGLGGWADRFARRVARDCPGLHYANLAVRGRRLHEVHDEQLPVALAMNPDLVGFCAGMNDVTAPRADFPAVLDLMEQVYAALAASGATIVTTTFPDVRRVAPLAGRFLGARIDAVNARIRRCALTFDLRLVELDTAISMSDLRLWSPDRLHGSAIGHERFAAAAAEALGLSGADHAWAEGSDDAASYRAGRLDREITWAAATVGPWAWRRVRGRSTGDGRSAKRPVLLPVEPATGTEPSARISATGFDTHDPDVTA